MIRSSKSFSTNHSFFMKAVNLAKKGKKQQVAGTYLFSKIKSHHFRILSNQNSKRPGGVQGTGGGPHASRFLRDEKLEQSSCLYLDYHCMHNRGIYLGLVDGFFFLQYIFFRFKMHIFL